MMTGIGRARRRATAAVIVSDRAASGFAFGAAVSRGAPEVSCREREESFPKDEFARSLQPAKPPSTCALRGRGRAARRNSHGDRQNFAGYEPVEHRLPHRHHGAGAECPSAP